MALRELTVRDLMRGGKTEITVRFDSDDLVSLICDCHYDGHDLREFDGMVNLVKKVEIRNPDGSWSLYPSATWLDGVESEDQLISRALVRRADGEFHIMSSTQGVPDGKLLVAAEEAGVYTETIDG